MNKKIPFIANANDDMHCVPAVFRMLHKYYFEKDLTWNEVDSLLKVTPGKGTWTFVGLTEFAKKGLDIVNIEPLDYEQLYKENVGYLRKIFGKDTANYYISNSNIESVIKYIPEFLKTVKQEARKATIDDIVNYLKQDALIGVEINSTILNSQGGFSLHYVLIYEYDGEYIHLHDPGLPPIEGRKVTINEFRKAFAFDGANEGITIFKRKTG